MHGAMQCLPYKLTVQAYRTSLVWELCSTALVVICQVDQNGEPATDAIAAVIVRRKPLASLIPCNLHISEVVDLLFQNWTG